MASEKISQDKITEQEYHEHECTQTPEDGCNTCVQWADQNNLPCAEDLYSKDEDI